MDNEYMDTFISSILNCEQKVQDMLTTLVFANFYLSA
jgi:hypothetical protein